MVKIISLVLLGFFSAYQGAGNFTIHNTNTGGHQQESLFSTQSSPIVVQDVLFATNEDCDLYIGEEFKGTVSKKQYTYLKLAPGTYTYKVKCKLVPDELKETFTVREGEQSEVFIDLLFFIDEKKTGDVIAKPTVAEKGFAPGVTNEQKAVIKELISNMVPIKGGKFVMGNNRAPSGDELEHPVTISSFLFNKYEVTQHQWNVMMGYNPSDRKDCNTCPVENVSWEEVMKFIRKVTLASNRKFRLPTEAEWEYVAKLGGKSEIDKAGGQEEYIKSTSWYFGNSDKRTHSIGQKRANVAGIYDLLGNVSEWCSDWYGSYYYKDDDSQIDPEGPPLGKEKVFRGGSFVDYTGDRFRPSLRNKLRPTEKSKNIGFRLVLQSN